MLRVFALTVLGLMATQASASILQCDIHLDRGGDFKTIERIICGPFETSTACFWASTHAITGESWEIQLEPGPMDSIELYYGHNNDRGYARIFENVGYSFLWPQQTKGFEITCDYL